MVSVIPCYIDPGTGSGLITVALIGVVSVIAFISVVAAIIVFAVRKSKGSPQMTVGAPLGFCPSCGQPAQEQASFCRRCGASLHSTQGQKK